MAFLRRLIPLFASDRTIDVTGTIRRAVANRRGRSRFNIDTNNLALGNAIVGTAAKHSHMRAVDRAAASGVIVVASAGNFETNSNPDDIKYAGTTSPGNAPSAIAVGAYDHTASASPLDDQAAANNSRGPVDPDTTLATSPTRRRDVQSRAMDTTLTCSISTDGRQFAARNISGATIVCDNIVWDDTVHYNLPTWNLPRPQEPDGTLPDDSIAWGDNIDWAVQPELNCDNIAWRNNIVLGQNIVWGDNPANIAWASWDDIVWGTDDNFVREHSAVASDAKNGRAQR